MQSRRRTNTTPVDPPDGGWGWVVALAGCMITGCTFGISRSLGVFFVPWKEQFVGTTAGEVALIQSMVLGISNLAAPIASGLGRKFGFRPVIMAGGVIAAAGFCLSRFASNIFHLYITIGCLVGFGSCLSVTNVLVCVGRYFTTKRLRANGITTMGGSLAAFALPPLFQLLIDEYGTKGALLIAGGVALQTTAFGALLRPIHLKSDAKITIDNQPNPVDNGPQPRSVKEKDRCSCNISSACQSAFDITLLKEPSVVIYLISVGFQGSNNKASNIYVVPRAKLLGIEDYSAAFLVSIIGIVGIVGRLIVGLLPERKRFRRIDQYATTGALLGCTMMFMPLATSYGMMVAYSVVFGLLSGALVPLTLTTCADLVDTKKLPSAMGMRMFVIGIASLAGPPVSGALRDVTGSYDWTFLLGGACVLVGGLIPFLLHMRVFDPPEKRDVQEVDVVKNETPLTTEPNPTEVSVFIVKETSL